MSASNVQNPHVPEGMRPFWIYAGDPRAPLGRAGIVVNPAIEPDGDRTALLGWYECVDDVKISRAIFAEAETYCRAHGFTRIIGPLNGTTWHSYRVAEPSDAPPFFLDVRNPDWYASQFFDAGFFVAARYYSAILDPVGGNYSRVDRFLEYFAERGIIVRGIRRENFEEDLRNIYTVSTQAFRNNYLYTPISFPEFRKLYTGIENIADERFVLLAFNRKGHPLGFIFAVTDPAGGTTRSLIIKTVAVVPDPEARGLGTLMVEMVHKQAAAEGYHHVIHALMHQANASTNISAHVAGRTARRHRSYLLFARDL